MQEKTAKDLLSHTDLYLFGSCKWGQLANAHLLMSASIVTYTRQGKQTCIASQKAKINPHNTQNITTYPFLSQQMKGLSCKIKCKPWAFRTA